MPRKAVIILHKEEWERLKAQAIQPQQLYVTEKKCFKELPKKAEELRTRRPQDKLVIQGKIKPLVKQEENNHDKDITELKEFIKRQKHAKTANAIAKAKKVIFDNSCYGKQLLSALAFSKTQEEREAQIKFNRELKNRELYIKTAPNHFMFDFEEREKEGEKLRKARNLETALINKSLYEMQMHKHKEERKTEAQLELEDARLMKLLLDFEKAEEERKRMCDEEQLKEFEQVEKKFQQAKIRLRLENDEIAEKLRKMHERKVMKIQDTHKQIYEQRQKAMQSKLNYKLVEEIEKKKQKCYNEFVEKGIVRLEKKTLKKEQDNLLKQKVDDEARSLASKYNIMMFERLERGRRGCQLTSDRQCLINICHKDRRDNKQAKTKMTADGKGIIHQEKGLGFLTQPNSLKESLRRREEQPSPWNALSAMHAQFTKEASETLAKCRYKNEARRVVNEYRRIHGLNTVSLPVANY